MSGATLAVKVPGAGAAEMVTASDPGGVRSVVYELAASGRRVLVVANGSQALTGNVLRLI